MTEKPYQANDPEQVKRRQSKADLKAKRERDDLTRLLELPEFRRYLWRHMNETCGMLQEAFSTNGSVHSFNSGKQSIARALFAEVDGADPLVIPRMMTEHAESLK